MSRKPITFRTEKEMPIMVVSSGTTEVNKTGSWRYLRPVYQEKDASCSGFCLSGNDVREFVTLVSKNKMKEAWHSIMKTNPFPAVSGRICPHPCKSNCNRRAVDASIRINDIEAKIGDFGISNRFTPKVKKGKMKALVMGSGPIGLSCAYHLMRLGYSATVFESGKIICGSLRTEMTKHKVKEKILDDELKALKRAGLDIKTNVRLKEIDGYDVVFVEPGETFDKIRSAKVIAGISYDTHGKFIGKNDLPKAVLPTQAIKAGRILADMIDNRLKNRRITAKKVAIVKFDMINKDYFEQMGEHKDLVKDASRCLSCGKCIKCDNCLIFCPDCCIKKTEKGYKVDYDYCKGCGICAEECPRGIISLEEEGT
ncbi:hypothetical protein COV93_07860 [Candidatus Woesearchaeota archaeon CG11_big_fil_rev_8_21_14_0_20_43_8]|nr:MAG: hypothetical protein COV93_07860 [Candidatus Woesearchaeota archaeon CG11_big_fil_rev_8_21_14_0_20_43_8]